jgi:L-lactate dehydrogenase complex protein LldG
MGGVNLSGHRRREDLAMGTSEIAAQPPEASQQPDPAILLAGFTDRAASLGVTVTRVADGEVAAAAIAAIAVELDAATPLVSVELARAAPGLIAALARNGLTTAAAGNPTETNDAPLGLSLARLAIAETGSVLLAEGSLEDRGIGLLVSTHVVICPTDRLVPSLDEAAPVLRELALRPGGGYATLVTGPSRTADIERVLTVGVQGPARLAVLFVDRLSD